MNRKSLAFIAVATLLIAPVGTVSAQYFISTYNSFTGWFAVIFLGVMVSLMLIALYYMIGAVLGNQRVKASALSMFVDALGTIVIVVIIIVALDYFGSTLSLSQFVPPQSILNVCEQVGYGSNAGGPPINFLNAQQSAALINIYGTATIPQPINVVCNDVIAKEATGGGDITTNIDYGLASTYVIIDNLTNQTGSELDGLYYFESLIYFLRSYKVTYTLCEPIFCGIAAPTTPEAQGDFAFATRVSFQYFDGYVLGRLLTPYVTAEIDLMFYMYTLQLIGIILIFLLWPYMLAAGLILRSFTWTRRVGGLLIATVIVGLLIFPAIYMFQYLTLRNMTFLTPIGAGTGSSGLSSSTVDAITLCGRSINYQGYWWSSLLIGDQFPDDTYNQTLAGVWCYTTADSLTANDIFKNDIPLNFNCPNNLKDCPIPACPAGTTVNANQKCFVKRTLNFYVFPSDADVINLYTYYPNPNMQCGNKGCNSGYSVIDSEIALSINDVVPIGGIDAFWHLLGLFGAIGTGKGNFNTIFPNFQLLDGVPIGPENVYNAYSSLQDLYGLLAIPGYIIPILDILIFMSAVTGLSQILGGETQILGISRFI